MDFSLYQYAANNPINFIDVNGDSIAIGRLIDRVASFFGVKTEYIQKVEADISAAKNDDPAIKTMIEELENSTEIHRIKPTRNEFYGNEVEFSSSKAKSGMKQGSIIKYNPDKKTVGPGIRGEKRTPRVGLVHELTHSSDLDKGTFDYTLTSTGVEMYEVNAVNMENKSRARTGDKKRTTYGYKKIPKHLLK